MASNYKNPPLMSDGLTYEDWKTELQIWANVTDLDKKKQGSAVFLSLQGKARETVRASCSPTDMSRDDGLQSITNALDKLYLKEASQDQFENFDSFIGFRRPSSMPIKDYIIEWDLKYKRLVSHKMALPDGVQAYALLKSANLSTQQEQLCRATCFELTYKNMKQQIERTAAQKTSEEITFMAQEPTGDLLEEPEEYEGNCDNYETYYTRPFKPQTQRPQYQQKGPKQNPIDQFGNPRPCSYCRSIYHWADKCPDAPSPLPQQNYNYPRNYRPQFQPRQSYQPRANYQYQPRQPYQPRNPNKYHYQPKQL